MKKILLAVLISVFLLSAMTVPALSQDEWTVGLSVGDTFTYEGTVEWEADEGVPFPPNPMITWLVPFNGTDWFTHTVKDVSGTTITWENVAHWKNGTETNATVVEDITNSMYHYAIGANMEVGDQIAPSNPFTTACIIDETIDIEYQDTTRETNHAWMNLTDGSGGFEYLWDKATGIQVKVIDNSSAVTEQGNATWFAMAELVETNLWECAQPQDDWTVGLSVGDWFKFKATLVLWEGNASFPPMGMEFLQRYNESDWAEWTVTDIEGFNVTIEVTTHWKNGTETVDTMTEDITSSGDIHIIAANLTEGTELRPETTSFGQPFGARYLNASIMREYESGARETNVVIYDWDLLGNVYHIKALFDKEIGMHVYFQMSTTDADEFGGGGTTYSYNATFELIETNIEGWTVIPEFPTGTAMLLIFVAVTACVGIYRRKKLKHQIG